MSRPFDEARYRGLLEGLEVSVIPMSVAQSCERTGRLDSSYFTKEQLAIRVLAADWPRLGDYCERVVCGPFGSNVLDTNYVETGIPMLRPFNLRGLRSDAGEVVYLSPTFISAQNLKLFRRGDIAFARVGDVGCGLVVQSEITISPNIIVASLSEATLNPYFAVVFFNTRYGRLQMEGAIKAVAQPTISTEIIRELRIPILTEPLQTSIQHAFEESERLLGEATFSNSRAEQTLLRALDLETWQPPEPLTYTRPSRDAFAAGRLDAEYFAPRVAELLSRLNRDGLTIGGVAPARHERFVPGTSGTFDYIEISGVRADGTVTSEPVLHAEAPSRATWYVKDGDVITSMVRPIRRLSALIAPEQEGYVCSSGFVALQPVAIPAEVLLTYLRLPQVCELLDLHTSASLYPAISEQDLLAMPIPRIDSATQTQVVESVRTAQASRRRAAELLDAAKRAVEIAIESDEASALEFLNREVTL